jgi:4-hydroxybenzoate polyprenyltransferase
MRFKVLKGLIVSIRPRQWLKNLSLYAAAVFWGELFNLDIFIKTSIGVVIFCFLSSAMYLFNDVIDAGEDRNHPIKKKRPIAAGTISVPFALSLSFLFSLTAAISAYFLSIYFLVLVLGYFFLQIIYSLKLRSIIIVDALAVAMGFTIRVYAGSWIIPVPLSSWLAMATIGLSLVIAFGKRRSEKTLAEKFKALGTRETLRRYPKNLLDSVITMSAAIAAMSYSLFAFQTISRTDSLISLALPRTVSQPKLMMLTIPLVLYGLARYLYVIYEKREGESPEEVLLSDRPLLAAVGIWVFSVLIIIYALSG